MSLLSKGRMFAKTCNFIVQTSNVNKFTSNFVVDHVRIKAFAPVSQLRFQSTVTDNCHIKTIYEGKLSRKIKYVKVFSLSTSVTSLLVQPYLLPKVLASQSMSALIGVVFITGFFAFVTPIMLHLITSKYVTTMKYDSKRDVYIASVYNILARQHQIEFTPDDVSKPGMGQMITTCYVNDTPLFFDFENFTDVAHYSKILGYDKPMDFQLETPENPQSVSPDKPKKN